MPRSGFDTKDE